MKPTGIIRRLDDVGRIGIPNAIRETLDWRDGDPIELYTEKDMLCLRGYKDLETRSKTSSTNEVSVVYSFDTKYAVVCEWAEGGTPGFEVLCVTTDYKRATKIMKCFVDTQKAQSWIRRIDGENISNDGSKTYTEIQNDDSWAFYMSKSHDHRHICVKIIDITNRVYL